MRNLMLRFLVVFSMALPFSFPVAAHAMEVQLMASAEVSEGKVGLVDVTRISGASRRVRDMLEDINLGPDSTGSKVMQISRNEIAESIRDAGIGDVKITGASEIKLRKSVRVLSQDEMVSAVRSFLKTRLISRKGDVEIKLISVPLGKVLLPRGGDIRLDVMVPANTRFVGRTPLILRVVRGASEIRRIWVTAEIAVYSQVPVARRPIRAQELLQKADFEIRRRDMASLPVDVVMNIENIIGAVAVRSLSPGDIARKSDVRLPFLVKRGHLVRVRARRGKLLISAIGKSLDAGRRGDVVRVINIDSNKPIQARVIENSSVEVLF